MNNKQIQQLKKKIDQVKIVSFDMYDTLVFRKTKQPQDIFDLVGFQIGIKGFSVMREKIQQKAARYFRQKYGYTHPSLHEIYQYWSRSSREILQAEQIERKLEECLAVRSLPMYEILQYAKERRKRIIITSDMYLERFEIKKILKSCAITEWDAVYISSEVRKTKYDGTLYDYILEKEKVAADEMLHIGDNRHSDIEMAARRGIQTYWYRNRERDLAVSLYKSSHPHGNPHFEKGMDFWYSLGYQTGGPLYMGLCLWLKETAGDKKLCCLSRDGYNLTKFLPQFGILDVQYIYASRRALLLPHMTKLGPKELELLPPYSSGQTVGEILSDIGLDGIAAEDLREAGFDGLDAVIQHQRDIAKCRRLYKKNESRILEICRQERSSLERYFDSKELFQKEVCFFDSGWHGTSQYLMQKIYKTLQKECKIHFYYAGVKRNAGSKETLKGCHYQSYFAEYLDKRTINKLLAAAAVLELFFSVDMPAVKCYAESGIQFDACQKREYIRCLNQGIADYLSQNSVLCTALSAEAWKRFGIYHLVKLVLEPDSREAERIGDLEIADHFCAAGRMKKYIARISRETLKEDPFLDIYWEQGVYRHPQNAWYVKAFVWSRQRAVFVYRAVRQVIQIRKKMAEGGRQADC